MLATHLTDSGLLRRGSDFVVIAHGSAEAEVYLCSGYGIAADLTNKLLRRHGMGGVEIPDGPGDLLENHDDRFELRLADGVVISLCRVYEAPLRAVDSEPIRRIAAMSAPAGGIVIVAGVRDTAADRRAIARLLRALPNEITAGYLPVTDLRGRWAPSSLPGLLPIGAILHAELGSIVGQPVEEAEAG
jgi:hypothetical protein